MSESDPVRILVVEDNPINQKVVKGMLQHFGYAADFVVNGEEALQALDDHDYALIFMDIQMPVMDGHTATKKIRELDSDKSKTTIIAMTANAMEGDREECLAVGMDDYISKPLKPELLQELLNKWLP
jgi:CheY-like chemotaxis protein